MATLVPTLGSVTAKMTGGERRFAHRLQSHLENDYLCWYDVPVGPRHMHPDFVVLHPRRGILVLEVKDWKLETIQSIDKHSVTLHVDGRAVKTSNPLEQARQYAHTVCDVLANDRALAAGQGSRYQGRLGFPWGYGVVLANISRQAFRKTDLGSVIEPQRVICQDEMLESVDAEAFQRRLWGMFSITFRCLLTLPQIDRVRWHLFPEVRVTQGTFDLDPAPEIAGDPLPEIVRVMDLQQEQLARSMGEGHRVIHGVAGSGKTMILGYRMKYLAQVLDKPILVLCYNVALAARLKQMVGEKRLAARVNVYNFHQWCAEQVRHYHMPKPAGADGEYIRNLVATVISGVDKGQIPRAQYGAVLIDEGHDFEAAWLMLIAQMVDPESNSLLLLYDDGQSLYGRRKRPGFSFAQLGIQARGRTTVLKLNYRNTAEVLAVAYEFARDVLAPEDAEEDGIPILAPETAGRHGPQPELAAFRSSEDELLHVVRRMKALQREGALWRDIAVLYRTRSEGKKIADALSGAGIPLDWLGGEAGARAFRPHHDSVKVMTMHSSKGLEFPVVFLPQLNAMPHPRQDIAGEAKLLYVAMTRAMQRLLVSHHGPSAFVDRFSGALTRVVAA